MTTIYFPLALISIWGEGSVYQSTLNAIKLHEILDHTMLPVSAILLVCMHTMTEAWSKAYLNFILFNSYLLCLRAMPYVPQLQGYWVSWVAYSYNQHRPLNYKAIQSAPPPCYAE